MFSEAEDMEELFMLLLLLLLLEEESVPFNEFNELPELPAPVFTPTNTSEDRSNSQK